MFTAVRNLTSRLFLVSSFGPIRKIGAALVTLTFAACAIAQTPDPVGSKRTKLEAFDAVAGALIIQGSSTIGQVGDSSGTIVVRTVEYKDGRTPTVQAAAGIELVLVGGRLQVSSEGLPFLDRCSVDGDEIDSLVGGIDSITKASKDATTTLDRYEMTYRTRCGLLLSVSGDGKAANSMTVGPIGGGRIVIALKKERLLALRELIVAAKAKIPASK